MDAKDAAVIFGAVALFACLYWYFYQHPAEGNFFFGRSEMTYAEANGQMMGASEVCLVENVTNALDPRRGNIMNCGVDFASALGGIKEVNAYVIEGGECTSLSGIGTIADCAREINAKGCYIIFIGNDEAGPMTLDGLVYVPIGLQYQNMSCSVKVSP